MIKKITLLLCLFTTPLLFGQEVEEKVSFDKDKKVKCLVKTPDGDELTINSEILEVREDTLLLNTPSELSALGNRVDVFKEACTHHGIEVVDGEYLEVIRRFKEPKEGSKEAMEDVPPEDAKRMAQAMGEVSPEKAKEMALAMESNDPPDNPERPKQAFKKEDSKVDKKAESGGEKGDKKEITVKPPKPEVKKSQKQKGKKTGIPAHYVLALLPIGFVGFLLAKNSFKKKK